jgi:hypothetical protein
MNLFAIRRCFVVTVLILLANDPDVQAQSTWTGLASPDNNWGTGGNWDTSVPGSGGTALFNGNGNSNTNISLGGGAQAINTITFDTANAAAYNLGVLDSGDQFIFDAGGSINVGSGVANAETINAAIDTGGDLTINTSNDPTTPGLKLEGGVNINGFFNVLGSGAITIDRPITGPGALSSTLVTGSLNLNAQSTYSSGTFFNSTTNQPAIRLGVDTVGSPGAVTSGPLGTGVISTMSAFPAVFQPVGADRTIANDWAFTNAIFVGSTLSAPLVDATPHNLTLSGNISLGTTGRVLTNNMPAGVALYLGVDTVTSTISLGNRLSFQTQAISGTDGGVTIINDPIVDGSGTGSIAVQNNAIVVLNNANNTYTGLTLLNGSAALPAPKLIVNGAITGGGAVTINNNNTGTSSVLGGTGSVDPSQVNVKSGGTISPGLQTLTAAEDDSVTNIGTFRTGNLTMRGGSTFYYQFDSSGAPDADLLNVNGTLSLQCTTATCATAPAGPDATGATLLAKDLAATSTALSLGTKLTLISYAGMWDNTTFDGLANGASLTVGANTFTIKYDDASGGVNGGLYSNFVTLTAATATLPGDWNQDGKVDAADYVVWRKDPVGHGEVPGGYNTWRANFGNTLSGNGSTVGASVSLTSVPEPAVCALLSIAAIFAMFRRGVGVFGASFLGAAR